MAASDVCLVRPSIVSTPSARELPTLTCGTRRSARLLIELLTGLLAVLAVPAALAQASCYDTGDTATANYSVNGDGTISVNAHSDPTKIGLMWKRCVEGKSGAACAGSASEMDWQASLDLAVASRFAGFNDWRMPSRAELESLVVTPCDAPTVNQAVFPGTPYLLNTWTGETVRGNPGAAWIINWFFGSTGSGDKSLDFHARLVRGGGSSGPLTAQSIQFGSAPTGVVVGVGVTVTASNVGPHSTNPIRFSSATPGVCAVVAATGVVTPLAAGGCTIAADQYGRDTYSPAPQALQSFAVDKGTQSLTFGPAPSIAVKGSGTVVAMSAMPNSGNAVTYSSTTPLVCDVSAASGVVTPLATGSCVIAANQAGNANYHDAPTVTQNITIAPAPCRLDVDGDGTHHAHIDGLLLLRYMLGISGPALVGGLHSFPAQAQRTSHGAITAYLNTLDLDIDGSDGPAQAATDGAIVVRAMLGFRGAAVTAGLPMPAAALRQDWATIGPHLSGACAMPLLP